MISQAITAFTATAATSGEPMANTPKMISRTPQAIDHPEACRTNEDGDGEVMCISLSRVQDGTFCASDTFCAIHRGRCGGERRMKIISEPITGGSAENVIFSPRLHAGTCCTAQASVSHILLASKRPHCPETRHLTNWSVRILLS